MPINNPRPYRHLFFDLDHTLWDFEENARATLGELYLHFELEQRGVKPFEEFHRRYIHHNELLWDRYRKGFIGHEELRLKRMTRTLLDFKVGDEALARQMGVRFLDLLPLQKNLFPHTIEVLDYLSGRGYALHLITNGFEKTQQSKLQHSGLSKYFSQVITSESSQSLKPHKAIFDHALQASGAEIHESIMLGDSQEVDIEGARNMGMDTVFVNHLRQPTTVPATYTVFGLKELEGIF